MPHGTDAHATTPARAEHFMPGRWAIAQTAGVIPGIFFGTVRPSVPKFATGVHFRRERNLLRRPNLGAARPARSGLAGLRQQQDAAPLIFGDTFTGPTQAATERSTTNNRSSTMSAARAGWTTWRWPSTTPAASRTAICTARPSTNCSPNGKSHDGIPGST